MKEFMFWGCFSYYEKGPCYIWKDETVAEKKAVIKDLEARNTSIEETNRRMQEITNSVQRIRLQNKLGTKPRRIIHLFEQRVRKGESISTDIKR